MKNQILIFAIALFVVTISAQQKPGVSSDKGTSPILAHPKNVVEKLDQSFSTYAVIIGISDYQDKNIPDLQYANKDAEAFSAWLQSKPGGNLTVDKIKLLTNEKATNAAIYFALNWLMEVSAKGDEVIIYFSGHGDVETKTLRQNGFLLGYDTPSSVYMAGAVSLGYLQDVITTLTEKNGADILVITDACHSGKLAGSKIGGAQITNAILAKQFASETKILSCQPNEFSLEGIQWGGGRGAFSFHLLEGLTGLADKNHDGNVTLNEIDRYLGDMVSLETAPVSQTPFAIGDRNRIIAYVDKIALAMLMDAKSKSIPNHITVFTEGIEDDILALADTSIRNLYLSFKNAIARADLLKPDDQCAWYYYHKLSNYKLNEPFQNFLRNKLAISLLDEIQQAINALLANDPEEAIQWQSNPDKYKLYPEYIKNAIALLNPDKILLSALQSKQLYFEAYHLTRLMADNEASILRIDSLKKEAKLKLLNAIKLAPDAAYLYHAIGMLYASNGFSGAATLAIHNTYQSDSLVLWSSQATELAPYWLLPYVDIFSELLYVQADELNATGWLEKAMRIDSANYILLENKAYLNLYFNKPEEAEKISRKLIELRPDLISGYSMLATSLWFAEKYTEAELINEKIIQKHPANLTIGYTSLGFNYFATRRFQKAKQHFNTQLENSNINIHEKTRLLQGLMMNAEVSQNYKEVIVWADSLIKLAVNRYYKIHAYTSKAFAKFQLGEFVESDKLLKFALNLDPTPSPYFIMGKTCLALIAEQEGDIKTAERFFNEALSYGYLIGGARNLALYYFGVFLMNQNRLQEAKQKWDLIVKEFPRNAFGYYGLALYHAKTGNPDLALDQLDKALENWYPLAEPILKEPIFNSIRKSKRFQIVMNKYFTSTYNKH